MICVTRNCVPGDASDDFITTVLPQANAVQNDRTAKMIGAFQGAIDNTTPAGRRIAIENMPGLLAGMISPFTCVVRPAASFNMPHARLALNADQGRAAPVSAIMISLS
jgi:hypothetical protein